MRFDALQWRRVDFFKCRGRTGAKVPACLPDEVSNDFGHGFAPVIERFRVKIVILPLQIVVRSHRDRAQEKRKVREELC